MGTGVISREYSDLNLLQSLGMSGAVHMLPPYPPAFVALTGNFALCLRRLLNAYK